MKFVTLLLATLFALPAFAAEDSDDNTPKPLREVAKVVREVAKHNSCPNKQKLGDICNAIGSRVKDKDPESYYVYDYQRKIYEASCADPENDSEEEASKKIQAMWNAYEKDFKCNSTQFDVPQGSILKLAVKKLFRDVLEDAVMVWKVNLNRVDPTDNRTVLDYVKKEIDLNKGNANEPILKEYYEILRDGGAKHRNEL